MEMKFRAGEVGEIVGSTQPLVNAIRAKGIPGMPKQTGRAWAEFGRREMLLTRVIVVLIRERYTTDMARQVAAKAAPKFDEMLAGKRDPNDRLLMHVRRIEGAGGVVELAAPDLDAIGEPTILLIDLAKIYRDVMQRIEAFRAERETKQ